MGALVVSSLMLGTVSCGSGADDDADADDSGPADPGTVVVKMYDSSFKPADIKVVAGSTVTFDLPNIGQLPHNMRIATAAGVYRNSTWVSIPETINPGRSGSLAWEVPTQPGTYKFRCDIHPEIMVGTITVE